MTLFVVFLLVTFSIISNGLQLSHEIKQSNIHCGVRATDNELIGRVVGGRDAQPGEVPFFASIQFWYYIFNDICSGVFISDRWILTSASCLYDYQYTLKRVLSSEKGNNKTIFVLKEYNHPNFNPITLENDIALLFLNEPVELNKHVQPICLPEPGEDELFYGLNGTLAGQGILDLRFRDFPELQITTVPIFSNTECQKSYAKAGHNRKITESVLCAGYPVRGKMQCHTDIGSLLMVNIKGYWVIAGILSSRDECTNPDLPRIYTRIGFYLNWIKETIH